MKNNTNSNNTIISNTLSNTTMGQQMLNKIPEITVFFWVIKVLATTVGETAADFLSETLNLGLTFTTIAMTGLLIVALFAQFRARKYVPGIYWVSVVLISIVGTLFTDNLVDNMGVPLIVTTIAFAIALAITFGIWYSKEKTLSIHSIYTTKREAFYWLAILFTFSLGTAAGDLFSEGMNFGYGPSIIIFAAVIALIAVAHFKFNMDGVLAFWIAYILTRPLGASIGDFMSQSHGDGGLALGTVGTSAVFLVVILGTVAYLTKSKVDQVEMAD